MATPIQFDQANKVLGPPDGRDDIQPLYIYNDQRQCVSCWELTPEEATEVARTGRVFINILSGHTQPPVYVWAGPLSQGLF